MSKAITEKREDAQQPMRWQTPMEVAPSALQDAAPLVSRWVGAFGLALVVLGGVSLVVYASGRTNIIGPVMGSFFTFIGLGGLLFHAANDAELQIRRAYMGFGFLWLGLGAILALLPYKLAGSETATTGALFLPYGLFCLVLGLLFTMAFVRNETEVKMRDIGVYVVGGVGAALALAGFLGGTIETRFLNPYGVVLILLGFVFLWVFISMRDIVDDLGYWAALGVGAVGLVFLLIALGRSFLPPLLEKMHVLTPGAPQYLMPAGVLLMAGGLLYVALSAAFISDRQLVVLTRRELGTLFFSPLAYLVLLAYTVLGGLLFANFVITNLWDIGAPGELSGPIKQDEPIVAGYILSWFPIIAVLMLVPVVTMRMFSEEKRTGTLEMMFTAPVDEAVVVLSKFFAVLIYFMLVWAPWGLYLVGLRVWGGEAFDYRPLVGFAVVLLCTGASFLSMGVFFSSVTRNQLVAAVFTFVGMFVLLFFFFAQRFLPTSYAWVRTVMQHVSFVDLWFNVMQGRMASRDLLIYLSATVFWLFLTIKVLQVRKWW
jgi:ABC-type transport system involved in multi-copper enzyme maturation permease subunit